MSMCSTSSSGLVSTPFLYILLCSLRGCGKSYLPNVKIVLMKRRFSHGPFIYFILCYLETLQRLGHIASRVFHQKAVYFYCCVFNVSIVKFTDLILWYMNLMNNGQMDRGNENPTQYFPWWLRKTTKKPQSGWSAPGFEPGTSRMRVSCVTTEPPRSVFIYLIWQS